MGEWKDIVLGEVAEVCLGKMLDQRKNRGQYRPYLANTNVQWGRFELADLRQMRFQEQEAERYGLKLGDIVMCEGGEPGRCAIWRDQEPGMMFQKAIHRIRPFDGMDPSFLYYCLFESGRTGAYDPLLTGSTIKHLPRQNLLQFRFRAPSLATQRRIAHILGTLDDRIELNRRMNRTLEKMAAALFKSWFIDFDPVHAKAEGRDTGLPVEVADLFPHTFEDSDLGQIPKGWKATPLTEAIEINPKRTLAKGLLAPFLEMSNMPTRGPSPDAWRRREMGSGMKFVNGDTLVARITPCLENGKTAFVDFLADGEVGWGSTEYIVLRPSGDIPPIFAYLLARTADFRNFAIQQMTGSSGRQRVPADSLTKYSIAGPEIHSPIFRAFGQLVSPLFRRISAASRQSRNLSRMRDALLPKLMSGEIEIPATETGERRYK